MPSSPPDPARPGADAATPPLDLSFEELYEEAPCGYLSLLPDGTLVKVNRTLARSLGHPPAELAGHTLRELLSPGSRIYHASHWWPLLELQDEVREVACDLLRADGTRVPVLLTAVLVRDAAGTPAVVHASVLDATDRRRYERELVAARDHERTARRHAERLLGELEVRAGQQAAVSRLGAQALEGRALPVLFQEAVDVVHATLDASRVTLVEWGDDAAHAHASAGGDWVVPTLSVPIGHRNRPFGTLRLGREPSSAFSAGDVAFVEGVANVLAGAIERTRSDEATEHRATHDPLTGLPNRALLTARLEQEVARTRRLGTRFAVCLLDLDDFKLVNDSLGHPTGDALLQAVAIRLTGAVRAPDLVARLGGDEFVVLCGDLRDEQEAGVVVERIARALGAPFALQSTEHVVRASIGLVVGGPDSTPADVLRDGDLAMYRAKERGRGQVARFDEAMRDRARHRLLVEAELRRALRDDELRVFYQPVLAADGERLLGLEALVRWEHPERGLVPPGEFIPVAEECGLVVELGRFVLGEAARQLVAWRAAGVVGADVRMAVNVSGRQLAVPGLAAEVAELLEASGLAATPHLLGLEITETVLMQSGGVAAAVLGDLAALGVGLMLDDFGTGASSLSRLKGFPVDTLKVDRSFVAGLGEPGSEDDAIVAAIIGLADALGLQVVAEGVETAAQHARLRDLACGAVQGFLFARPLPAAEVERLLAPGAAAPLSA